MPRRKGNPHTVRLKCGLDMSVLRIRNGTLRLIGIAHSEDEFLILSRNQQTKIQLERREQGRTVRSWASLDHFQVLQAMNESKE